MYNFSDPQGVAILIYGDTGTGKTRLLSTHKDIVVLGTEAKPLALNQPWRVENNVDYMECSTLEDLEKGVAYCIRNKRHCAIDSISFWQSYHQVTLLDKAQKERKEKAKKSRTVFVPSDKLAFDEWQSIMIGTIRVLRQIPELKAMGLDVIVTAHITTKIPSYNKQEYDRKVLQDPDNQGQYFAKYSTYMPHLDGQMRGRIAYWFDALGFMERTGGYTISFDAKHAETKDFEGRLGTRVIDNSLVLQQICLDIKSKL